MQSKTTHAVIFFSRTGEGGFSLGPVGLTTRSMVPDCIPASPDLGLIPSQDQVPDQDLDP